MKLIKITILTILCNVVLVFAQDTHKESLSGIKKVHFETDTTVHVEIGQGNELIIKDGCKDCNEDDHEHDHGHEHDDKTKSRNDRSKGLTAIYATGVDNTGIGMQIDREGDVLRIRDLKSFIKRNGFTLVIPATMNLNLDCGNLGSAHVVGLTSELEVNTNVGHITLDDVTGPVTAYSSTGTIEVVFKSVNQNAPISISSSTGVIDVTVPANTKADVDLRSTMGSVYSNFELVAPRKDGLKVVGANRNIKGKLNNGGVNISLKASTGNIYLRKQQ